MYRKKLGHEKQYFIDKNVHIKFFYLNTRRKSSGIDSTVMRCFFLGRNNTKSSNVKILERQKEKKKFVTVRAEGNRRRSKNKLSSELCL